MNKLGFLNYTTTVSESKSLESIRVALVGVGAESVSIEHDAVGKAVALRFSIKFENKLLIFAIDCKATLIAHFLQNSKVPQKFKTDAQAQRVAWRLVKTWVDVQTSLVKLNWYKLEEIFLPMVEITKGITFFRVLEKEGLKRLTEPNV